MVLKKVIIFSLMKLLKTTMLQGEYIWNLVSYLSVTVAKVIPVVCLQYFQTQLGDSGILDELVAQGVEEEDTIKIGEYEFDYLY